MLVLSRKQGEAIRIFVREELVLQPGDEIRIVVSRISANKNVRLGVEARPELVVLREEEEDRPAGKKSVRGKANRSK